MDPDSVAAVTPFRLLDLPREVRDDIYEAAIFDLSPPDMFLRPKDPDSVRLRKMNTDVLLGNRQVYWEARDVIVRRGRLIMMSIQRDIFPDFEEVLTTLAGITPIDPMYRRLCILSHHIDAFEPPSGPRYEPEPEGDWEFILHRQDAHFFFRVMMGEFDYYNGNRFRFFAVHTLNLHCSSTYGQHEFSSVSATQTLVLQEYRNNLRDISPFTIRGPSIGWENGLYRAVLQDIQSIDDRQPTKLIDDLRSLEQEGSQILLQTGDFEAANVFWVKALGICQVVRSSFCFSAIRDWERYDDSTIFKTHVARWIEMKRQNGNECAVPFIELWYKLISHRLSGALRLIEQGRHLAPRDGRTLRPKDHYLDFVRDCRREVRAIRRSFQVYGIHTLPQPSVLAHLCFTEATIHRLLNATTRALVAFKCILRATELAPDDESIQQEKERIEMWIRRLVDDGTLESFPEP